MPELRELLQAAADAIETRPGPPFASVKRQAQRRTIRRRACAVLAVAGVAMVVAASVAAARGRGGHQPADGTSRPCVTRNTVNAHDVFAAIPRSGIDRVTMSVGDRLTVGWLTCGETGDLRSSEQNPKDVYLAGPGRGLSVEMNGVASARFQAFKAGNLVLTGSGNLGSNGALDITIEPPVAPVGVSDPSPYPGAIAEDGVDDICIADGVVDATGSVTATVHVGSGTATLDPPSGVTSRFTAQQTLDRYRSDRNSQYATGHPKAVFGLLTDANSSPFPRRQPVWVVVTCDGPPLDGHWGFAWPSPAPGTSASPGGTINTETVVPYDEQGRSLYIVTTGYPDAALRAEMLFEVPFSRSQQDSADGRQVGISYGTDDACATFDHIETLEHDARGAVYVRVWMRLLPGATRCTSTDNNHTAVVGLRNALGERQLIRGSGS
jgi:hypothetical protein